MYPDTDVYPKEGRPRGPDDQHRRQPLVSALVDGGHDYEELRGAELLGRVETVRDVPRSGDPDASLEEGLN
ncbi:MAG: hypothetical protein ACRDY7_01790 [Acidimicrobiia bacterium]